MRFLKDWIIALILALILFLASRPALANLLQEETNIDYDQIKLGVETIDGFSQVYYEINGNKNFVTSGNFNSRLPFSRGEYLTWVTDKLGGSQIFLMHIPSASVIQLTSGGTNLNPRVSKEGKVVWQGWVGDEAGGWQIFLFDGVKVSKITEGDTSLNPDIEGDFVVYARKDIAGIYRSAVYSISDKKEKEVTVGLSSKRPRLENGRIFLLGENLNKEFPLKAQDLFLLDLVSLSSTSSGEISLTQTPTPEISPIPSENPPSVSEEEVAKELEE